MPESEAKAAPGLTDDLALLKTSAVEAAAIAMRYFRRDPQVWTKEGNSPVSEADYAVDRYLRETLMAARPDYGWLSEETEDGSARLSARRVFVVDPIDGTRDFLAGGDHWCVSIAVVEDGRPVCGVLLPPVRKCLAWATKGQGAFIDGKPLSIAPQEGHAQIGGPAAMVTPFAQRWSPGVTRVAYAPSLAYRVAMIATGAIDGTFIKANAQDWDLAAADLILEEAGGLILDASGQTPKYASAHTGHGPLVAGSGRLLQAMQSELATAG